MKFLDLTVRARCGGAGALAALIALASAGPVAAGDAPPECFGRVATITGTDDGELIRGTPAVDVILAGGGDDVILGLAAPDRICGEGGNDTIIGGPGNDLLEGSDGADTVEGGRNNDRVDGGDGDGDIVLGGLGDDSVRGGPGNGDEAAGDLGIDYVYGGPGDGDLVSGDYGWDRMSGGPGKHDVASFASAVSNPGGAGVTASLRSGLANGDGRDTLRGFEDLEGSAFDDTLIGDDGPNVLAGGPGDDLVLGGDGADRGLGDTGSDRCRTEQVVYCGPADPTKASAYAQIDRSPAGGGGLDVIGGPGDDVITVSFDPLEGWFSVRTERPVAIGFGCERIDHSLVQIACRTDGPVRRLMIDTGAGDDRLKLLGALKGVEMVRAMAGPGDDVIQGGSSGELLEAGPGRDVLRGGGGSDALVGGIPGPDRLIGGRAGDLLAAGGACVGGALIGGRGRDNASFAETPAHPGILVASLRRGIAYDRAIPDCHPVRLAHSDEDLEGSFDYDVLIGNSRDNSLLGQPGRDSFYGLGGDDAIDAEDGDYDNVINCGPGEDYETSDPNDSPAQGCEVR